MNRMYPDGLVVKPCEAVGTVASLHYCSVCFSGCKHYMVSGCCEHTYAGLAKQGLLDASQPWRKSQEHKKKKKGPLMSHGQARSYAEDVVVASPPSPETRSGEAREAPRAPAQDEPAQGWQALNKSDRLACLRLFYPQ